MSPKAPTLGVLGSRNGRDPDAVGDSDLEFSPSSGDGDRSGSGEAEYDGEVSGERWCRRRWLRPDLRSRERPRELLLRRRVEDLVVDLLRERRVERRVRPRRCDLRLGDVLRVRSRRGSSSLVVQFRAVGLGDLVTRPDGREC